MALVTRMGSTCPVQWPSQIVGRQIDGTSPKQGETLKSVCLMYESKPRSIVTERGSNNLAFCLKKSVLQHSKKMPFQRDGTAVVLASQGDHTLQIAEDVIKSGRPTKRHLPFYVMLPADTVSGSNTVNRCKAIQAGLLALKALGVDGVVMQVWWGIVEGDAPTKYDWSAYLTLVNLIQAAGLKVQASMCFHGCKYKKNKPAIGLPSWVLKVGENDPNIFFTDRAGNRYRDCLSLAVDNLPLFDGRSPLKMFSDVLKNFRETFSDFIGDTIVEVSVGLGPDGELRYPSFPEDTWKFPGVGEFQCYDKYMLANLLQHSQEKGHSEWGLSGPHDAPSYCQWPHEGGFFVDNGGAWDSPYGQFFLSWYSAQLLAHGDRMLSLAASIFKKDKVIIGGKLPVIHWWYKTKSHAAELTSGFYNVEGRDGYDAFVEMFAKNASLISLPNMDVSDMDYPSEAKCSPQSVLLQIRRASQKYGVPVAGENSFPCGDNAAFKRILDNVHLGNTPQIPVLTSFTFKSMGQSLYSPENWRLFVNFYRNIDQYASVFDENDLPLNAEEAASCSFSNSKHHQQQQLVEA
uniref:Beta-amylase n=1 Tax=Wollemia nobilis TaxID=56998 RepID=A0A0C9QM63_9CONI